VAADDGAAEGDEAPRAKSHVHVAVLFCANAGTAIASDSSAIATTPNAIRAVSCTATVIAVTGTRPKARGATRPAADIVANMGRLRDLWATS
jgi:hypothetical protein